MFKMLLTGQQVTTTPTPEETKDALSVLGDGLLSTIANWVITVGVKIVIALVIMLIAFRIITKLSRRIEKLGEKPKHDKTIMKVLGYIVNIGAKAIVLVCLIGYLGIDTSGITALIASLGVCIGLAVNGAVANIAGGVLIIITRPFKVDDYIEAQGVSGTVTDIHLTYTKVVTPDNKVIYLPNGALSNGNIINYSEKDIRRVDLDFLISYESSFEEAKQIITDICNSHELILKDKRSTIRVASHSNGTIDITTKVWTSSGDYWTVYFDLLESIKKAFDEKGIAVPHDQLDVHIKNN